MPDYFTSSLCSCTYGQDRREQVFCKFLANTHRASPSHDESWDNETRDRADPTFVLHIRLLGHFWRHRTKRPKLTGNWPGHHALTYVAEELDMKIIEEDGGMVTLENGSCPQSKLALWNLILNTLSPISVPGESIESSWKSTASLMYAPDSMTNSLGMCFERLGMEEH